jgi:hypothetical protein
LTRGDGKGRITRRAVTAEHGHRRPATEEVNHLHPYQSGQLADDRRRQRLAQAEQGYLAARIVALAKAARRAERAERQLRRALNRALRLRAKPGQ